MLDINSSQGSQRKTRIEKLHTDVIKDPDNPQELGCHDENLHAFHELL